MKFLDLTLPTPAENLACDEALLDSCDARDGTEVLRFWEPQQHFVVVGYSNRVEREVNLAACRELGISVLRRCSGGGTVLQGPGCLNYSLILRIGSDPGLQTVTGTNRFVMGRNRAALERLLSAKSEILPRGGTKSEIAVRGHTDLAISGRKFSGNAQRRKRRAVLFHGTFLLQLDLALIEKVLRMPSKQPAYRSERAHSDFLTNLTLSPDVIKESFKREWCAMQRLAETPNELTTRLATEKYSSDEWNLKM